MKSLSLMGVIFMALSARGASVPLNPEAWGQMQSGINIFAANFMKNTLGMLLPDGTDGTTKSEIHNALGLPSNDDYTKNGYQKVIEASEKIAGLNVGNKIYVSKTYQVNNAYQDMLESYFHSKSGVLDTSNAAQSAHDINEWVAEQTKGHIQNFIDPGQLTDDIALILLNAIYYQNGWAIPFDQTKTTLEPFNINEDTTKNVETMHATGKYNYGAISDLNAKYIELQYKDGKTTMLVIVPEDSYNVSNILENYSKINYKNLPKNPTQVKISIPKFECNNKFGLKPILQKLNINRMFENNANFNGISNNGIPIKVSEVQQQSYIKVNEEGSTASTVTGIHMQTMSAVLYEDVKINKPFFFAILSTELAIPIFMGYVNDPTQSA